MFCTHCGGLLVPDDKVMKCGQCHRRQDGEVTLVSKKKKSDTINVISKKDQEHLPETAQDCEKCGNHRAFFWTIQTRSADEPETVFYRCTKCSYTWRSYD